MQIRTIQRSKVAVIEDARVVAVRPFQADGILPDELGSGQPEVTRRQNLERHQPAGRGSVLLPLLALGPAAALQIGGDDGIVAVVITNRQQTADPVFFEMLGLEIAHARTVVVKSRGHFRAGFEPWFPPENVYEVDTPGLTSPVLSRFTWKHLPRPVYPLDEDAQWVAPER